MAEQQIEELLRRGVPEVAAVLQDALHAGVFPPLGVDAFQVAAHVAAPVVGRELGDGAGGPAQRRLGGHFLAALRDLGLAVGRVDGQINAIAPQLLALVQALVGDVDQRLGLERARRVAGHADAGGDGEGRLALAPERVALDVAANALGDDQRGLGRGLGQHHRELLAAVTRDEIGLAGALLQHAGDALQHLIPEQVAVGVVELLEVVHVEQDQAGAVAVARAALELGGQLLLEVAAVVDLGQAVGHGELLGGAVELGVLDGHRGLGGEDVQELLVRAVEGALGLVQKRHDAQDLALGLNGHGEQGPVAREHAHVERAFGQVVHQHGALLAGHVAEDAVLGGKLQGLAGHMGVAGVLAHQHAALRVEQEDHAVVVAHHALDLLRDQRQGLLEVNLARDAHGHLLEDGQLGVLLGELLAGLLDLDEHVHEPGRGQKRNQHQAQAPPLLAGVGIHAGHQERHRRERERHDDLDPVVLPEDAQGRDALLQRQVAVHHQEVHYQEREGGQGHVRVVVPAGEAGDVDVTVGQSGVGRDVGERVLADVEEREEPGTLPVHGDRHDRDEGRDHQRGGQAQHEQGGERDQEARRHPAALGQRDVHELRDPAQAQQQVERRVAEDRPAGHGPGLAEGVR
ncbi:hypothetical protein D3C72_1025410 [compost metagenome]